MVILFVVVFTGILAGCGQKITNINTNTIVTISRAIDFETDPILYIACNKAVIDYEKKAVIIEGPVSINGSRGDYGKNWVVQKMEIQNGNLVIYIPDDVAYEVHIGPHHILFNSKNWKEGKIEEIK